MINPPTGWAGTSRAPATASRRPTRPTSPIGRRRPSRTPAAGGPTTSPGSRPRSGSWCRRRRSSAAAPTRRWPRRRARTSWRHDRAHPARPLVGRPPRRDALGARGGPPHRRPGAGLAASRLAHSPNRRGSRDETRVVCSRGTVVTATRYPICSASETTAPNSRSWLSPVISALGGRSGTSLAGGERVQPGLGQRRSPACRSAWASGRGRAGVSPRLQRLWLGAHRAEMRIPCCPPFVTQSSQAPTRPRARRSAVGGRSKARCATSSSEPAPGFEVGLPASLPQLLDRGAHEPALLGPTLLALLVVSESPPLAPSVVLGVVGPARCGDLSRPSRSPPGLPRSGGERELHPFAFTPATPAFARRVAVARPSICASAGASGAGFARTIGHSRARVL